MFVVVIIIAVIAAIAISKITVEVSNNNVISNNKEINIMVNSSSIASVVKSVKDWTMVDTSVEETHAEAINVIFTNNGTWKMVRVEGRAVKFTGRSNYNSNNVSGWLFVNVNTGSSDMLLDVSGKSSAWEARSWFGNGNFALNTRVVVK